MASVRSLGFCEWPHPLLERAHIEPFCTTGPQREAALLAARRPLYTHRSSEITENSLSNQNIVDALLVHSRGQLALTECHRCEWYRGSNDPLRLPGCVFLAGHRNYACSCCLASGISVNCSFYVYSGKRQTVWEEVQVRPAQIGGSPGWLERGHPLDTFHPATSYPVWKHCQPDHTATHDLAEPQQEPPSYASDVPPPPVAGSSLQGAPPDDRGGRASPSSPGEVQDPRGGVIPNRQDDDTERLGSLRSSLWAKEAVVVITGAGISTNAGIPDFRSAARSNAGGQTLYNASAFSNDEWARELHADIANKLRSGMEADFTPFDLLLERLAASGQLRHHFTQNIDCRHTRLPSLAEKTTWLHGRADTLVCHQRASHTRQVTPDSFGQLALNPCPACEADREARIADNRRPHDAGFLRTNVLLYNERTAAEDEITARFENVLDHPVDAVLIVGTRLSIDSLAEFARDLCRRVTAASPDNLVVWVSKEPATRRGIQPLISFNHVGDCDEFAAAMNG